MSDMKERVFAVLDQTYLSDPKEIAEKVLAQVGDPLDALREVLPVFVRVVITEHRRTETPTIKNATPVKESSGSPRWRQAGAVFRRRYHGVEGYKWLGEFRLPDVDHVIDDRQRRADGNLREKAKFERLRELMLDRKVEKVSELPEAEVEGVMR